MAIAYSVLAIVVIFCAFTVNSQVVNLPYGKVQGRDNGHYYSYEGIPYAMPPVGKLRFEPPLPYKGQWSGVLNATKPSVECLQWSQLQFVPSKINKVIGTEDCLVLNVYTPKTSVEGTFPVVVMIHGGGFMWGSASDYRYNHFMEAGNAILVSINYRVGILGFLSAEHRDFSGNMGLKDQRLALEWVQQNIACFGGEPENVLVVGHSAGSASVHFQLLRQDFNTLAKAAVSLSGSALSAWALRNDSRENAYAIGAILNCTNSSALQLKRCLQSKTGVDLVLTLKQFLVFDVVPLTLIGPVIEDPSAPKAFLTEHPKVIMESGLYTHIPWLITHTTSEGGFAVGSLLRPSNVTQRALIEYLNTHWLHLAPQYLFYPIEGPPTYVKSWEYRRQYLGDSEFNIESYPKLEKMITDNMFKNSTEETIELHRAHGMSPIYTYLYSIPNPNGIASFLYKPDNFEFASLHGDDFVSIFPITDTKYTPEEELNSQNLANMLINFAASLNLKYGPCEFVDNIGHMNFEVMVIEPNKCGNMEFDTLP